MTTTSNTAATVEIDITLQGDTRTVAFTIYSDTMARSGAVFGCRVGNGNKVHLTTGAAFLTEKGWQFNAGTGYALNGQRRITTWADIVADGSQSKHCGTAIR